MIRNFVPFLRQHWYWLGERAEPGQFQHCTPEAVALLEPENSWTGVIDGEILICCGTVMQWPTRHTAWAILSKRSGPYMRWITRECRKVLARAKGRVELSVRVDFPEGLRWAEMLGLRMETPRLQMFGSEGEDHVGFVRIN